MEEVSKAMSSSSKFYSSRLHGGSVDNLSPTRITGSNKNLKSTYFINSYTQKKEQNYEEIIADLKAKIELVKEDSQSLSELRETLLKDNKILNKRKRQIDRIVKKNPTRATIHRLTLEQENARMEKEIKEAEQQLKEQKYLLEQIQTGYLDQEVHNLKKEIQTNTIKFKESLQDSKILPMKYQQAKSQHQQTIMQLQKQIREAEEENALLKHNYEFQQQQQYYKDVFGSNISGKDSWIGFQQSQKQLKSLNDNRVEHPQMSASQQIYSQVYGSFLDTKNAIKNNPFSSSTDNIKNLSESTDQLRIRKSSTFRPKAQTESDLFKKKQTSPKQQYPSIRQFSENIKQEVEEEEELKTAQFKQKQSIQDTQQQQESQADKENSPRQSMNQSQKSHKNYFSNDQVIVPSLQNKNLQNVQNQFNLFDQPSNQQSGRSEYISIQNQSEIQISSPQNQDKDNINYNIY